MPFSCSHPLHLGEKNHTTALEDCQGNLYFRCYFLDVQPNCYEQSLCIFFLGQDCYCELRPVFNPFSSLPAAWLCVTLPLTTALPLLSSNPMVIAKMSIYKRMRRACCFDCGRSERDCSCMSGRVRGNMDTLERAFPLSSVSVNDCSTSFRACKLNPNTRSSMSVLSVVSSPSCVVPCGSVSPLS